MPEPGGSQRYLAELYSRLPGCEVTVLTREATGAADWDARAPMRVLRVRQPPLPRLRAAVLGWRLHRRARALLSEGFDQMHCGQLVETGPWATALAARHGVPSLAFAYGEELGLCRRRALEGRLLAATLRRAGLVAAVSGPTRGRLRAYGVADERLALVPPGVEAERWACDSGRAQAFRRRHDLEGRPVALTLTRLIPRKGVDTVLRALPAVLSRVPDLVYVIAGTGPDEPRLRGLAADPRVAPAVRFLGGVAEEDLVACYHAGDVFVMPNRELPNGDLEGFGQVFLEASACGRPVIGGRSGGAVDAVVDGVTGFLVDPTSPQETAARLVDLLTRPDLRASLGAAGRRRAAAATWSASAAALRGAIDRKVAPAAAS